ncbi:MAG TPA: FecR domain-containing protein [Rhodothermales bacterium]|nr:FecR domain-containing protein [Rhodothermales bacterium]
MSDPLDLLTHDAALSPDEKAVLARAAAADPAVAEALAHWDRLGPALGLQMAEALPAPDGDGVDRDLLLLAALDGRALEADETAPALAAADSLLDDEDRARLEAAAPALEAALARHPGLAAAVRRHRADRDLFEAAWDEALATVPDDIPTEAPAEVPAAIPAAARPRRADDRPAARESRDRSPLWRVGRYAAAFAFVAVVGLSIMLLRRDAGWERITASEATTVDLPDGSTVELAAGAELMVPEYDGTAEPGTGPDLAAPRTARLVAGQALFRVAHTGPAFIVETPTAVVTVLGTTFGVTTTPGATDVVLVEGRVQVAQKGEGAVPVTLAPGQGARVEAGEDPTSAAPADLDAALAWTGDLYFTGAEPLGTIAARLASAFDTPISVDPVLATQPVTVTGFARADGVEPALRALALAVGGRVEGAADGGYEIVQGSGNPGIGESGN